MHTPTVFLVGGVHFWLGVCILFGGNNVDMFPWTGHVESIVLMTNSGLKGK